MDKMYYTLGYEDECGVKYIRNSAIPGAFFVTRSDGKIFDDFTRPLPSHVPLYYQVLIDVDEQSKKIVDLAFMGFVNGRYLGCTKVTK